MPTFLPIVFCLLTTFWASAPATLSAQSPWTRTKAGFYAQGAWQHIPTYDAIFDRKATDGTRLLEREITENAFQFYGEYGIARKTTVWVAVPYRVLKSGNIVTVGGNPIVREGILTGLGNITVAVRQNFVAEKWTLSGQLRVDMPNNRYQEGTGLRTGYDALTLLTTVSIGRGYGKYYWFGYGGWGGRGVWENHFVNFGFEGGVKIGKCWAIAFTDLWENTGSKVYFSPIPNLNTGMFLPDQSYWSFGAKGICEFNRFWGAIVTAAGAFQGDLVPQRPALSLGTYFKWD